MIFRGRVAPSAVAGRSFPDTVETPRPICPVPVLGDFHFFVFDLQPPVARRCGSIVIGW